MPLTKSMSSSEIRKLIRDTAGDVLAFVASDRELVHRFRVHQSENGKQVMPEPETREILKASARYFHGGGVIYGHDQNRETGETSSAQIDE